MAHLKNNLLELPPEERRKRLKERLKEKETQKGKSENKTEKKKEIEKEMLDLQQMLRETEEELGEREKQKEKVPIEEVAKEESEGLSPEGKEVLEAMRGVREGNKKAEEKSVQKKGNKDYSLEEEVFREQRQLSPETQQIQYGPRQEQLSAAGVQYGARSEKPLTELYQEASALKKSIEEKGYVSSSDERRAEYLTGVVQQRLDAAEEGTYSLSEQAARAASLTQMIGQNIQQSYKSRKANQWYQS